MGVSFGGFFQPKPQGCHVKDGRMGGGGLVVLAINKTEESLR